MANNYKIELEDDAYEILEAETDEEAIEEATRLYEFFWHIVKLDKDMKQIETIF